MAYGAYPTIAMAGDVLTRGRPCAGKICQYMRNDGRRECMPVWMCRPEEQSLPVPVL